MPRKVAASGARWEPVAEKNPVPKARELAAAALTRPSPPGGLQPRQGRAVHLVECAEEMRAALEI